MPSPPRSSSAGVGCSEHPDNRPNGARQVLLPTTLGDQGYPYMQGFYQTVWVRISAGDELSNSVSENEQWDTAMAVGWLYEGLAVGRPVDFNYVASFAIPPAPPSSRPSSRRRRPSRRRRRRPGPRPPEPEDPARVVIRDPLHVPDTGDSVDVIGRCRTEPGGRCFVEIGSGRQRRADVVRDGELARLALVLGRTQRRELRRDCATELNLHLAVYQPAGQRARTTRRTISVFCASLRGRCVTAGASVFTAGAPVSPAAGSAPGATAVELRMAC